MVFWCLFAAQVKTSGKHDVLKLAALVHERKITEINLQIMNEKGNNKNNSGKADLNIKIVSNDKP